VLCVGGVGGGGWGGGGVWGGGAGMVVVVVVVTSVELVGSRWTAVLGLRTAKARAVLSVRSGDENKLKT
jgi:hypothetical protein